MRRGSCINRLLLLFLEKARKCTPSRTYAYLHGVGTSGNEMLGLKGQPQEGIQRSRQNFGYHEPQINFA